MEEIDTTLEKFNEIFKSLVENPIAISDVNSDMYYSCSYQDDIDEEIYDQWAVEGKLNKESEWYQKLINNELIHLTTRSKNGFTNNIQLFIEPKDFRISDIAESLGFNVCEKHPRGYIIRWYK